MNKTQRLERIGSLWHQWNDAKIEQLEAENKRLRDAINQALPSISSAMGDYNDARYIDIDVLYKVLKDQNG